uniref:Thaumatin-like protein n=1 Tax=Panagrellus redivivus TaxID=6233 RepID=A0A7E4VJH0_PANRE
MLKLTLALLLAVQYAAAVKFTLYNNCGGPIWPGILGSTIPEGGGFRLEHGQSHDVYVPDRWQAGRFWTRTWCDDQFNCATGFCGNKLQCSGAGGRPPASLAEFTLYAQNAGNQDFYDVSLVDGWNVEVLIEPVGGTFQSNGGQYDCKTIGQCNANINDRCPDELKVWASGTVAGCDSACTRWPDNDFYCCRNAHGTPQTCKSSDWPKDYAKIFKDTCPDDYSYAYDDKKSTFTCRGSNGRLSPDYKITFC